jgi:hypothetical protein
VLVPPGGRTASTGAASRARPGRLSQAFPAPAARPVGDHREWMAEEEPFLAGQRTWERADMLVAGTPKIPFDPASEVVVALPLTR